MSDLLIWFLLNGKSFTHVCVLDSRWASGCLEEYGCCDFHVLVLRPWPLNPTEGHLWHVMVRVHMGQACVKLSPPWLYCLTEFREGALPGLSQRVQSLIRDRLRLLAPWRPTFWAVKIRALGMAADEYRHVEDCKVAVFKCKLSCCKKQHLKYHGPFKWTMLKIKHT